MYILTVPTETECKCEYAFPRLRSHGPSLRLRAAPRLPVHSHLQQAAVAVLPPLQEAVPAHRRGHHPLGAGLVQQAPRGARGQVPVVARGAAAAEGLRDVPAESHRETQVSSV